jgi:hypothetical protein
MFRQEEEELEGLAPSGNFFLLSYREIREIISE